MGDAHNVEERHFEPDKENFGCELHMFEKQNMNIGKLFWQLVIFEIYFHLHICPVSAVHHKDVVISHGELETSGIF